MTEYLKDIQKRIMLIQIEKAYIENLCSKIRKENEVLQDVGNKTDALIKMRNMGELRND